MIISMRNGAAPLSGHEPTGPRVTPPKVLETFAEQVRQGQTQRPDLRESGLPGSLPAPAAIEAHANGDDEETPPAPAREEPPPHPRHERDRHRRR